MRPLALRKGSEATAAAVVELQGDVAGLQAVVATEPPPELTALKTAASICGYSLEHCRRLVASGAVPGIRRGRFVDQLPVRPRDRHLTAHLAKILRAVDGGLSRFEFGCIPSAALAKERQNDVPHPCVRYSQAREIFYKKKAERRKAHDCRGISPERHRWASDPACTEHNPGQGWPKNPKPRHHYARNGAARPWYSLLHFLCEPLLTDHQNAGPRALRIPAFEPDRADAGFVRFDAGKSHRGSARITHNRAVLIEHPCSPCVPPGPAHRFPKRLACMC
jgi:hypothetical protein